MLLFVVPGCEFTKSIPVQIVKCLENQFSELFAMDTYKVGLLVTIDKIGKIAVTKEDLAGFALHHSEPHESQDDITP